VKILIRQFLGQNHSWSVFGWNIATSLIKLGHDVHLFPTDGIEHLPPHLKKNVIGYAELNKPQVIRGRLPDKEYDCQISYTCMKNFPMYLANGKKNRFGMWSYEWKDKNVLPDGFAKCHLVCDKVLVPSEFSKDGFIASGIPGNKIVVLRHGIDAEQYSGEGTIDLGTKKSFKILANIAQLHKRKNIPGLLDVYGKAFTKDDDVCLILKASDKEPKQPFDVSLKNCLHTFYKKYPQHAEVKIFKDFLEDISVLYRSVDATITMAHAECFYLPGIESIASGKVAIAPNYGGQQDFLNEENSLLIEGKIVRSDPTAMYWGQKSNASWIAPDMDDAVKKLQFARDHFRELNEKIGCQKNEILDRYNWDKIAAELLENCVD
jgi:glycosyltransferase involved in cell wall biosynthesis